MADEPTTPATGEPPAPEPQQDPLPNTDPQPTDPPEPEPTKPSEPTGDPSDLGDAGKKALAAERKALREAKARIKELEPYAAKARELEESQKTELQRLQDQAAAEKARAAAAELRALRLEVAAEKGLSASQARRLVGATKEELADDADDLLASFQPAAPKGDPQPEPPKQDPQPPPANNGDRTRRPVETLTPGAAPNAEPDENAAEIAAAISRGL